MCEFWICGFSAVCQITNYTHTHTHIYIYTHIHTYIYISLFTLNYVSLHNFCLFGHLVNKVWSIVNVGLTYGKNSPPSYPYRSSHRYQQVRLFFLFSHRWFLCFFLVLPSFAIFRRLGTAM